MFEILHRLLRDQRGASAAEYALILAIISLAVITAALALSDAVGNSMIRAASCIDNDSGSCR